jgi:hypothetical protein
MKTAMQELIDNLDGTLVKSIFQRLERDGLFIKALEKEKEQIMNSYREGVNAGILYCNGKVFISKEEYYNQSYNQNNTSLTL